MSVSFNRTLADRVMEHLLAEAAANRETAGYNGEHHDGGASHLEEVVAAFRAGLCGAWPKGWEKVAALMSDQMAKEADPEYKTYLRLKGKFGDK